MNRLYYILLFLVLCFSAQSQVDYSQKKLDRERWQKYRENYKYHPPSYSSESSSFSPEEGDWISSSDRGESNENGTNGNASNGTSNRNITDRSTQNERKSDSSPKDEPSESNFEIGNLSVLGYVFIIIVIALIIGFIVYHFINRKKNKTIKNPITKDDTEEINPHEISKTELQLSIEECIANKDYRKAIRLYYVFTLKTLSEKQWIDWKKEKTNASYLVEMSDKKEYADFQNCTQIYEYAWYGKVPVSSAQYKSIEPIYRSLILHLNPQAL